MKDQSISLAGGCFWGMEALYRRLPGVTDVVCGYANGDSAAHANYEDVCTGITGFREAVQVTWDPAETSLEAMLFAFFAVVDVELPNRQGADIGTQYQTGIGSGRWQTWRPQPSPFLPWNSNRWKPSFRRRNPTSATWKSTPGATATSPLPDARHWSAFPSGARTTPARHGSCSQSGSNPKKDAARWAASFDLCFAVCQTIRKNFTRNSTEIT